VACGVCVVACGVCVVTYRVCVVALGNIPDDIVAWH